MLAELKRIGTHAGSRFARLLKGRRRQKEKKTLLKNAVVSGGIRRVK